MRSLAQLHGGSASADSAGGLARAACLPCACRWPGLTPTGPHAPRRSRQATSALRIMVVDDNVDAAATLAELLTLTGHTVQLANSGAQAVALAASFLPDVMFLDIGMPGMNGYQTARAAARRARPRGLAAGGADRLGRRG
ncbi:response regulator [Massilia sp. B-10]|nr:response regulator [Massilia sp. B-10]